MLKEACHNFSHSNSNYNADKNAETIYDSSTFHKQTHEIINVKAKGFLVVVIASLFGERDVLCSKPTK